MKDLIERTRKMMGVEGVTGEDIHHMLVEEEGLSEYQAFLTYIGAKMVYKTTQEGMTFGDLTFYRSQRQRH